MFEESLVVQSAVSAFNNAALAAPAFFWLGLLMTPLFYVVYVYGNKFMDIMDVDRFGLRSLVIKWTVILALLWLVLFGGNYIVLRDSETLLPFVVAFIAFIGMVFVGGVTRHIHLPVWRSLSRVKKWKLVLWSVLLLSIIALTDVHTWWGPILQIIAFVGGFFVGRYMKKSLKEVPFIFAFMFLFTVMILMQPEFFRFGQLGNLTLLHLIGVVCVGAPIVCAVVLRNVEPRGKIYKSAFVKLKWMMRCLVALAGCLFVMTESVPVFIGLCILIAGLSWLKVIHAKTVSNVLADRLLMLSIFAFGLVTIMPVVSCLAIFGWISLRQGNFIQELREVL